MDKLRHFEESQRALERGLSRRHQTDAIFAASQKIILQSLQLIHDAKLMTPQFSKVAE